MCNTKYRDNRTMQRLHKWIDRLPFLILLFDVHSFHGEAIYFLRFNFSTKAVFICILVRCTKNGRPLISIQQESYCPKHYLFSGVSQFTAFFIDFQADRPATLIFLRDHRGWPWLLRKDFLSNRNLYSEWKLSSFCKYNTFFLLVIAALTICNWFQEIIYGGVLFHRLFQWYFLLHFLNFIEKISCRTATIVSSSEFFGSVRKR